MSERGGIPVLLPSVVISESTRGDARDARVNRVIARVQVVPIDEEIAREAARLKTQARMKGVGHAIDALVVAVAVVSGGGAVLTSDLEDVRRLAEQRPSLRIKALRI